jgi:hypothetical protein
MRISRLLLLATIVAAPVVYLACGDDDSGGGGSPDAGSDTARPDSSMMPGDDSGGGQDSGTDTGTDAGGINRGPTSMDFDPAGNGDPISMHWNETKGILYIADNRNNQIWTWTDKGGFAKLVKVLDDPAADDAGRTNLGQITQLSDGTLVVPRFGFGTVSTILHVDPATGDAGQVPGLAANRKRTALAVGASDQLWGGYFFSPGDHLAVVTKDSLTSEADYATGFEKPVGVLVQDGHLLVSDQTLGNIYSLPLDGGFAEGGPYDIFAAVPSCDALTGGPSGSVITGQFKPLADGGPLQLRQAFPDGGVQVIHPDAGLAKPQGVAYDKTNKRLFVADSNGTTIRTIKILPLD